MKHRYFFIGLVGFVLVACNSRPPVSKFVGKWELDGDKTSTISFSEDGRLSGQLKTATIKGTWEFKDDSHLLMKSRTTIGSGEFASDIKNDDSVKAFRFEGDNILFLGEPPQQIKLLKVK